MLSLFSKLKIRTKLVILLLVFGLLPLLAVIPILLSELNKVNDANLQDQKSQAATIGDTVDRNLFERYGDVQTFALSGVARENAYWSNPSANNPLIKLMNGYMANYGLYKLMVLVDTDGKVVAVNSADKSGKVLDTSKLYGQSFRDAPWFQHAMKKEFLTNKSLTGTVVEQPQYNQAVAVAYKEDGYSLTFSAPVYDTDGKILAVWANFADFGLVEEIVGGFYQQEKNKGAAETEITVIDPKGNVIVDYDPANFGSGGYKRNPEVIGKLNLADKGVVAAQEAMKGQSGGMVATHARKKIEQAVGYAHSTGVYEFPGLGWSVLVRTPKGEAFSVLYSIERTLGIVILVAALVIGLVGYIIGGRAARKIVGMANAMKEIAEDKVITIPSLTAADEIGDIARALEAINQKSRNGQRIRQALDCVTSNVMMADAENNIIYANPSVLGMLKEAESDIRKELRSFETTKVLGANIDIFHKNPSHQRGMLEKLREPYRTTITVGGRIFDLIASPVFDSTGKRLGTAVEWQDMTAKRAEEAKASRIQTSLDSVTSNVMLADETNTIIYMNPAVLKMMRAAEADIRKDLPNFDSNTIIGKSVDVFHKNPDHQRGMLEKLRSPYSTSISVGVRKFDLVASPVWGKKQERLGTVVEWKDVTAERTVEAEIQVVVEACTKGDFTKRLDAAGKQGFLLNLVKGINEINEVSYQGLTETVKVLQLLAEGKLTDKIEGTYQGTFDEIKQSLNRTIDQLSSMVTQIKTAAGSVSSASNEISAGSADLSQRTEQQASTLEETAASMEELTGTVRQNSGNAEQANKLATSASGVATRGGEVVEKAVNAMGRIEESAKKISDIIGVIDEIAFQTNLLALNAAVEAARAGEAGKGFAVVASEVRTLAGRSAEASKDIKKLIQESGQQVTAGSQLVNEAGKTLLEIVTAVKEVAKLISEIADASAEQSTGIDEINTAVVQLDENTQQNAALVEENTAAAASLVEQAEELEQLVGFFTLAEGEENARGGRSLKLIASKGSHEEEKSSAPARAPAKAIAHSGAKPGAKPPVKKAAAKAGNGARPPMKKAAGAAGEYNEGWEEF